MAKLTALKVKSAEPGRHADGNGLYLLVKPSGARSWMLRIQADGRRRDIGLGSVEIGARTSNATLLDIPLLHRKILTLAEAREKASLLRSATKAGLDPVTERDKLRSGVPTFREAAKAAHSALKEGLSSKNADAFIQSLEKHTFRQIGGKRVDAISAADMINVLEPIWTTTPHAGRKVRQRISKVLNFAHGRGWRPTEAPSASVGAGLPRQQKGGNFAAMPFKDAPAFVRELMTEAPTQGRRALLLLIFTASRPGEVRRCRWEQIDLKAQTWTRPAEIMKAREPHVVTLNSAAVKLLQTLKAEAGEDANPLLFASRKGGSISDMTMNKVLRDASLTFDAHGFRSSFRDWAAEKMPHIPDPVAEAALAHVVPDQTVRAYKRTDFLEMRRELLEAWSDYLFQ